MIHRKNPLSAWFFPQRLGLGFRSAPRHWMGPPPIAGSVNKNGPSYENQQIFPMENPWKIRWYWGLNMVFHNITGTSDENGWELGVARVALWLRKALKSFQRPISWETQLLRSTASSYATCISTQGNNLRGFVASNDLVTWSFQLKPTLVYLWGKWIDQSGHVLPVDKVSLLFCESLICSAKTHSIWKIRISDIFSGKLNRPVLHTMTKHQQQQRSQSFEARTYSNYLLSDDCRTGTLPSWGLSLTKQYLASFCDLLLSLGLTSVGISSVQAPGSPRESVSNPGSKFDLPLPCVFGIFRELPNGKQQQASKIPVILYVGVSINGVPPNHPVLRDFPWFSLINHPFGVPLLMDTTRCISMYLCMSTIDTTSPSGCRNCSMAKMLLVSGGKGVYSISTLVCPKTWGTDPPILEPNGEIPWKWWPAWWFIPLSKWVITSVISRLTPLIPFITRVVTHLRSVGWATKYPYFRKPPDGGLKKKGALNHLNHDQTSIFFGNI